MEKETSVVRLSNSPFGTSYWPSWLKWCPTSLVSLEDAEARLISYIKNKVDLFFVPIKQSTLYIRSMVAFNSEEVTNKEYLNRTPIVMVHGMGSGIGLWCKNVDPISNFRKLYAMDVLGFGFSSRPQFPTSPELVETMFTDSIEEWRINMGLEKFILLGHSMGGYLAYAYALKHPDRVRHLILADPWGFSKYDPNYKSNSRAFYLIKFLFAIMKNLNPLAALRFSGPFGPAAIRKFRPDLGQYFQLENTDEQLITTEPATNNDVYEYIYHCNAQTPSGEIAFKTLSHNMGWACNPMIDRVMDLDESVPITFLYGEQSWMDMSAGITFQEQRAQSFVNVEIIPDVGHHIYAEDSDDFNNKVNHIATSVDSYTDTLTITDISKFKLDHQLSKGWRKRHWRVQSRSAPPTVDK